MRPRSTIQFEPDAGAAAGGSGTGTALAAGAGGTPADWRASLPDDVKNDPAIKDFKTPGDWLKSYKHAQSMVGVDKIPKPKADWKPEQWQQYEAAIGVPDAPEKYPDAKVKVDGLEIDPGSVLEAKKLFKSLRITPEQAQGLLDYHMGIQGRELEAGKIQGQQALEQLQAEWKDNYKLNVQTAFAVVKQHGAPELVEYLEKSGLGNNVHLIKLFHKFGTMTAEDLGQSGGTSSFLSGPEAAQNEINRLQTDKEFMDALNQSGHPGHKAAVKRWEDLFRKTA